MNRESETITEAAEPEGGLRSRIGRRVGQATGAVALVLIPLVMHAVPAGATGTTTTRIETNASTNTSLGLSIFANANLASSGAPLTGSVTFSTFGPADDTCGSPVFTSTVAVSGTLVNSARFIPAHAGVYRWTSTYSGDATHAAAGPTTCGNPSATVTVAKASTSLNTAAAPSTPTAIHATTTLNGGVRPTGTITFTLTGPNDMFCSGPPAFTSTAAVNGSGDYDSGLFSPTRSGDYTWRSTYTGDVDNLGTSVTPCQYAGATQTVTAAPPSGDFDGTGRTQLSLFRPNTGTWYIQNAGGGAVNQVPWGQTGDVPVPGDYNADGRTDVAVFRPSTGQWLVKGIMETVYGASGDIPVPGDYNGDGRTDVAVFRPSQGVWYIHNSTDTATAVAYGTTHDIPAPGDYDGDGKTDIAVFRPSQGVWYIHNSSGGDTVVGYGAPGDIPVPADYNGDGKIDVGVWRPSSGTWYVRGMFEKVLGQNGDVPQPGDYDGDGRTDPTVFRPDPGTWFLAQTSAGAAQSTLGVTSDFVTSLVGVVASLTGLLG